MCSACGFPTKPGHWTDAGADAAGDKLQLKFRRAKILNKILSGYGLAVHDDGLTPGLQLRSFTGRTVIVPDLEAVWSEAEAQTGTALDPLDARFLRAAA
ncbi:hypothetical protein [Ruegeria halocynthiae]|uniref:hypothetical protein n=1 Tax=Ruegeria halocynthiae TaxID=985054 RepID=UPI00056CBC00|nr:hypothetical protein [Ruegeria halocynthiae]